MDHEAANKRLMGSKTATEGGQGDFTSAGEHPVKGQGPKGPQVATDGGIQPKDDGSGSYKK